jgi:hypothetical protein
MPEATKEQLWKNIIEKIKYPDGIDEGFVKRAALISMGQLFHRWKSDMNRKYVKKQLVPKHMGKITQAQWKEFVKQKIKPEALATSGKFADISKKNIYPHHLGSSGYVGKVGEWKKKLEEIITADKPNPLEGVKERTQHWILARSNLTEDGTLVYKKTEVIKVQQKALQVVVKQRLCLFQSDRKNDQLKEALDNPEHTRRICGVGSQMPWKYGFLKDSTSYKKRDRYKKTLEEKIEEKVNTLFENRFMMFIQNLSQEYGSPPLHLLAPHAANLSSMGSTTGLGIWYHVDDIMVDTPCRLHILLVEWEIKQKRL